MAKDNKKSAFKTMAEAIIFNNGLKNLKLPTSRVDRRKLSVDEIKEYVTEELEDAKKASEVKAKLAPGGWGDAEIENQIEWTKSLNLKEFFANKREIKNK